ncbi:unnamed protein product [Brachionus calyciflorus]|uniref:RWD domain-containing protein n=1 Tax=Brachionus calyciflorus TaxID=104777 RepID=A0A813RV54_9BILA|nr:unnamed protein product [Brachionus calyciflorus]
MSNRDEQCMEVEALESIFPEVEVLETDPFHSLRFTLKSDNYDEDPDNEARIVIVFKFTTKYPEEAPKVKIEETENTSNESEIIEFLKVQAMENIGMPMIYTLVCALIEKLNQDNENRKIFEKNEKERLERLREEEELKRFEGTKVTVESFLKWKTVFDKEMAELRKQTIDNGPKKTTGKQLFEKDESLFTSDLQFTEGEVEVEVDESLFQDLDQLDLEDDEDDEYNPDDDEETDEE